MVQELLSRALKSNFHITLLLLILISSSSVLSQSVLLPSDVVVVTVNSSGDSFDFIPLVPLKAGTSIRFSNGVWDTETLSIVGDEVEIELLKPIEAGTNIHVNEIEDSRVSIQGKLDFKGNGDRLFVYQMDEGVTRVIYGIGWGSADIWNPNKDIGSDIPVSISFQNNSLIQLGLQKNYQYYLRNGASGTPTMLAKFVADPAKWKGKDDTSFPSFGTTFRILKPPVVLFDESISTNGEGKSIVLNAAIYEHDGSRLTVDAVFNPQVSIADTTDINGFEKHTFNFTGLIGDAVYAIEIPIEDDENFEGTENAFFELQNLSKGSFGDFVSHVSFIQDNELPSVQISSVNYFGDSSDYIEIQNNENIDIDLSGWQLISKNVIHEFKYGTYLPAFQTLRVTHPKSRPDSDENEPWLIRNSGTLDLINQTDKLISEIKYRIQVNRDEITSKRETSSTELSISSFSSIEISSGLSTQLSESVKNEIPRQEGWYIVNDDVYSKDLDNNKRFIWNELTKTFDLFDEYSINQSYSKPRLSYLSYNQLTQINNVLVDTTTILLNEFDEEVLNFTISATDLNENGIINGSEGFNFLVNSTSDSIRVYDLLNTINSELFENAIYPYVYLWGNDGRGWMSTTLLTENELIPPNSSFWIRADSVIDPVELTFLIPQYSTTNESLEEENEAVSILGISISEKENQRNLHINFFENGSVIPRDVISPELEPELQILSDDYLYFGANNGINHKSTINLELIDNQKVVFPLSVKATDSNLLTLAISDWKDIPSDWKIFIEDLELEKEYELSQNWTFEFEYFNTEYEDRSVEEEQLSPILESKGLEKHRFNLIIIPPGVEEIASSIPDEITLGQNYPNPFNPTTTIAFYLPDAVPVKLSVFNVVGQPVAVLTEGTLSPGDHEFEWDASGLPSGMYIYQLEVGNKILTQKMTLVK